MSAVRVEHLLLGGEGREEADVRAPLHEAKEVLRGTDRVRVRARVRVRVRIRVGSGLGLGLGLG